MRLNRREATVSRKNPGRFKVLDLERRYPGTSLKTLAYAGQKFVLTSLTTIEPGKHVPTCIRSFSCSRSCHLT